VKTIAIILASVGVVCIVFYKVIVLVLFQLCYDGRRKVW